MRVFAITKEVQRKIDKLSNERERLEKRVRILGRQIAEIEAGQSPIKPGQIIEWESGGRLRRGKVLSVRAEYRGFEYRCYIITKEGRSIGYANVSSTQFPTLVVPTRKIPKLCSKSSNKAATQTRC